MRRGFGHGIGLRLAVLLATFGIVAMGLVGYTSYTSSRAALLNAAQRDLLTATQVLGNSFQARLDEVAANALMLAALPQSLRVANGADNDKAALLDAFSALLDVHPDYFQVRLISADRHGLELLRVDRDAGHLSRISGQDLQEKAHYPYVFNTLKLARGQVHMSDITINRELGAHAGQDKPTLRVATPLAGADGVVVALVVINIDLAGMFRHLQADMPKAYQLYLSNHWGDYLIHPDASMTFGFERGRREFIQDGFAPVAELIGGRRAAVVTTREDGEGQVAAFVRLAPGDTPDDHFVVLGLSQTLGNVVSEARSLGWNTMRIILLLSACAMVLAALVARAVTGPLRQMVEAVTKFSKERVVSELPSDRDDQIGLLARSLNDMQRTIVANIGELDASRVALRHLAQHDGLTGLPNRALFDDRLQQALAHARRTQTHIALLFVDLDGFKRVNDTFGHHTGDLLLITVAQRIHGCVRVADTAGRIGGDEFVMLLGAVGREQDALSVAEKVRMALEQPFELEQRTLLISASVGVAMFPFHGENERALALSADTAMYQAKAGGGNRVCMAEGPS
ncbi:MAG: diguanylate cyclase [Pseudomonadota bacterium]